jgi:hypothetical protein
MLRSTGEEEEAKPALPLVPLSSAIERCNSSLDEEGQAIYLHLQQQSGGV